jgi:hypothetical protein
MIVVQYVPSIRSPMNLWPSKQPALLPKAEEASMDVVTQNQMLSQYILLQYGCFSFHKIAEEVLC